MNNTNFAREAKHNKRKNLSKSEQSVKTNFFEILELLKSKIIELEKFHTYMNIQHTKSQNISSLLDKMTNLMVTDRNLFPVQKSKYSKNFLL